MKTPASILAALAATCAFATVVSAQESDILETAEIATQAAPPRPLARIDPTSNVVLKYEIRAGARVRPAYFGADEYVTWPDFAISFDYARLRGLAEFGELNDDAPARGFGLRGSLRYIGERSEDDSDDLKGLDDVPPALELGLGVGYRERNFEVFADARYGFIGHQAFAGEVGMDGIFYPTQNWELRLGPRVVWGGNALAETYFGVTSSESAASGLPEYQAEGGILGAGFEAKARYRFNDLWGIEAALRGDMLLNDAADSPITQMGSDDQFTFRLGVVREMILQF